jgi:hypothetical protein
MIDEKLDRKSIARASSRMDLWADGDADEFCPTCGQRLALVGKLPPSQGKPSSKIYKCVACRFAVAIPPLG